MIYKPFNINEMCVAGLRGVPVETVTCSSASAENFKKNRNLTKIGTLVSVLWKTRCEILLFFILLQNILLVITGNL